MYPGVIVEYDDQSNIAALPVNEVRNQPLFAALFTSDKGVEDWIRVSGADFFKMYGKTISFNRHGQPLLQAAMTINAGAELLCKRLVAPNASLANIGIVASLIDAEIQKRNTEGALLYIDENGNETTAVTDKPVMVAGKKIKYTLKSATNVQTPEAAHEAIKATCNSEPSSDVVIEEANYNYATGNMPENAEVGSYVRASVDAEGTSSGWFVYDGEKWNATDVAPNTTTGAAEHLLYVICDNGRGVSKKRIKITPNYRLSKGLSYTQYTLSVLEGVEVDETLTFSTNPNMIVNGQNISLQSMVNANSAQLVCIGDDSGVESFVEELSVATGIDVDTLYGYDILFGCTNRGLPVSNVEVDNTGIDLQHTYGQILQNGSNGDFGNYPIQKTDVFAAAAVEALDGSFDTTIFNVDQYRIDAFVDANYPAEVKRAIETLAVFREDFVYFRDQGLKVNNIDLIAENCLKEAKSMFCASYPQSYDIIDPYSKKQITVTIGYTLARLLVNHFNNGRNLPTAGLKHNMVIDDAIYGTLSFTPTICPDPIGNQKEKLDDMHVNYASYIDNQLVIESLYTSQEKTTQWSYINNVLSIQEVVKAIRTRCPAIRYTFVDGEDLEKYRADVEEIIAPYRSHFNTLELVYAEDATYTANKIFYAVLKVVYKDFIQTEWFKVTALSAEEVVKA